ncbi:MAG: ATP-dependent zinc protease [Alphaproteobacteria bacterium CG11_big_fil_rev_8_21_14_0_20_44_7]|nr:MAG: ATP-dependent zinc protease [Alphaproteobacteria bacterium CG11_big_fil_rev_8_21_14_0_20_44_7]
MTTKTLVGWEEWFSLPELGLPAIKAKIDSGAKTSSIHATQIKVSEEDGRQYVSFNVCPLQKTVKHKLRCKALLVDRRYVSDSGGHKEKRYVIKTPIVVNGKSYDIEITLADRKTMAFRMLLGRKAMRAAHIIVDPAKSCCLGKHKNSEIKTLYENIELLGK